jgi:translocation and assembly module TamB
MPRTGRDLGRRLAQLCCVLFALLGATPLVGEVLLRSRPAQKWVAAETARLLRDELGLSATFDVAMSLWPLEVTVRDLVIPGTDGTEAVSAKLLTITPRVFSLLAGRLHVGDVHVEQPRGRLVVRDGDIKNVRYRLPETSGLPTRRAQHAPFSSLALSGARFELDLGEVVVDTGTLDLDLFAEKGLTFELALRAAQARIGRTRTRVQADASTPAPAPAYDEDIVCRLDVRALVEQNGLLVRRLSLIGIADSDPARGTEPDCRVPRSEHDAQRVALRLSQLELARLGQSDMLVDGHVMARAPASLANRFIDSPVLAGWAGFTGQIRYDGTSKLPEVHGRVRAENFDLDTYHLAKELDADIEVKGDKIAAPRVRVLIADGEVVLRDTHVDPFAEGVPMRTAAADLRGIRFEGLMRDVDVTDHTVVQWNIHTVRAKGFNGTLVPLHIDGELVAETSDFMVFDRGFDDPARRPMLGVKAAVVHSRVGIRQNAFELYDSVIRFGNSTVVSSLVSIGFTNLIDIRVPPKRTTLDLADISPLAGLSLSGKAELHAAMEGRSSDPLLLGEVRVQDFVLAGFPLGAVHQAKVRFRPLKLDISDAHGTVGKSNYTVPSARLDFDTDASVLTSMLVESPALDLRDFLALWHFDKDPRFDSLSGSAKISASVRYALGGKEDRCGDGMLSVDGTTEIRRLELFGERFEQANAGFHLEWFDQEAGHHGMAVAVPNIALRKGAGALLGSLDIESGGRIRGHFSGTGIPVSRLDALGNYAIALDGAVSATAELGGTLDDLELSANARISPLTVGSRTLPSSELSVVLKPDPTTRAAIIGSTRCGNPVTAPFDRRSYDADRSLGTFHVDGALFGGQVRLQDLRVSRQRSAHVQGLVLVNELDLNAVAQLVPSLALSTEKPHGKLTAALEIDELMVDEPALAYGTLTLDRVSLRQAGMSMELAAGTLPLKLAGGELRFERLGFALKAQGGLEAIVDGSGALRRLHQEPEIDARLTLKRTDLARLARTLPGLDRASGHVEGELGLTGSLSAPSARGELRVLASELLLRRMPAALTGVDLTVALSTNEVRVTRGTAKLGAGTLELGGGATLHQASLTGMRLLLTARNVSLPLPEGISGTADADVVALWQPPAAATTAERTLPKLTGNVTLRSFGYTRRVTMTADIGALAQRGKRTQFEVYDPADDAIELDLVIRSDEPLALRNNLVDAELLLAQDGLLLTGTNQRFGLRGALRAKPGGLIRLRRSEFEIREGIVRFDDAARIAPQVDLTAVTEYRRYSEAMSEAAAGNGMASATATSASGGQWLITLHAYGDAEKLKIDLESEPALSQDDIFLLLTVGLTRTELDQARSASVGESVALEALGTLTGADRAVTDAVPVIDEFRFGSAYSSRAGRTEPTVTIGKRLAERIRANVTSGLAESREVRSNVEWKLGTGVSVEGSYDNVNDISSSSLGNLGADIRWRLEFE